MGKFCPTKRWYMNSADIPIAAKIDSSSALR
jgi:hypothetical protein